MRLFLAYLSGTVGACVGAGLVIGVWGQVSALSHGIIGVATLFALPLMIAVFTAFSTMFGLIPAAIAMLIIGLPVHTYLASSGRTDLGDYLIAGGVIGFCLAGLVVAIGHPGGLRDLYATGIAVGGPSGAILFRLVRGDPSSST